MVWDARQIPPRHAGAHNTFKEPARGMWGILNKKSGGDKSLAFMQSMFEAYVKIQKKAGKSKKRKKRDYDSSDSSDSE